MFKVDDLIMYGTTGVCRICKIGTPDFAADQGWEYYFLEPLYQNGIIYAPVENEKTSMRPVISAIKAKKLIKGIEDIEVKEFVAHSLQQLSQNYQEVIDEHSCEALLMLTKSICAKEKDAEKKNKRLGQIDRKYMKLAEELLYGELAVALGKQRDEIAEMVRTKLYS